MKLNLDALEIARQRNRLSKSAFASKLGISSRDLRRLREQKFVSDDFVSFLSKVTGFPKKFFTIDANLEISPPTFRKQATLSARERDAGEAAAKLAKLFWEKVEEEYTLPAVSLPDYSDGDHHFPEGIDRPRHAAAMLREAWGLGSEPIGNMVQLLERHGIRVLSLCEQNARGLSAFTFWGEGNTPFVYLNMVNSTERSRFDAAHELGHLVLHRHADASNVNVEREADRFASAFLIPKTDLIRHKSVPTITNLRLNKRRWKVSVAALVRAYRDNGLIDERRYKHLNIELSRRGWGKEEPDQAPREISGTWSVIKKDLWTRSQTIEDLAERAGIPKEDALTFTAFGGANFQRFSSTDQGSTSESSDEPMLKLVR